MLFKYSLRKGAAKAREAFGILPKRLKHVIYTWCTFIPLLFMKTKCLENTSLSKAVCKHLFHKLLHSYF